MAGGGRPRARHSPWVSGLSGKRYPSHATTIGDRDDDIVSAGFDDYSKEIPRRSIAKIIVLKRQAVTACVNPAVVSGEAELAVFVNNVLTAPGVDIVGPFPAKYKQELVFPAALAVDTKQKQAAEAFVDFIMSPQASIVVRAKGMTPGKS